MDEVRDRSDYRVSKHSWESAKDKYIHWVTDVVWAEFNVTYTH